MRKSFFRTQGCLVNGRCGSTTFYFLPGSQNFRHLSGLILKERSKIENSCYDEKFPQDPRMRGKRPLRRYLFLLSSWRSKLSQYFPALYFCFFAHKKKKLARSLYVLSVKPYKLLSPNPFCRSFESPMT